MISFLEHPGVRERHLQRRYHNPLFPPARRYVNAADLQQARASDHAELETFHQQFQALLERAVALQPNEESEVVLKLKADLDQAYALACGLPGDLSQLKIGIQKLISVTMNAVWQGAGNDPLAQQELTHEEEARAAHFAHLRYPLVAALVRPDSPIDNEELLPALLSAEAVELQAALWLFDPEQLTDLLRAGHALLETLTDSTLQARVQQSLQQIDRFLAESTPSPTT
ncbi:MAG TPA: hypothetical protein VGE50_02880 [Gammaproteobacteria bacterium]